MWYLICLGIGFAIGAGFLIWALRERSLRAAAEQKTVEISQRLEEATTIAAANAQVAADLQANGVRLEERVSVLRRTLEQAQARLLECNDPKTVKDWLDAELKDEVI